MAHRDRGQGAEFTSAFGELRTFDYGQLWPATTRMTHLGRRAPKFAVMHNAAFPGTVW